MLRDMIKKNNANARREPLWHRALAMFLAIQMACPPVMAQRSLASLATVSECSTLR